MQGDLADSRDAPHYRDSNQEHEAQLGPKGPLQPHTPSWLSTRRKTPCTSWRTSMQPFRPGQRVTSFHACASMACMIRP